MKRLTIDEHRAVAAVLYEIRDCFDAKALNKFKKSSETARRMWRALGQIDRLRSALDSLVSRQHPEGKDLTKVYYYGGSRSPFTERPDLDADILLERLDDVRKIINGRVPAPILDKYLRVDRALWALREAINDRPDDVRLPTRRELELAARRGAP